MEEVLDVICRKFGHTSFESELWLLKEPIPFDEVASSPWLLEKSTDLKEYATCIFQAEQLSDIVDGSDRRCLHAILRTDVKIL